MDIVKTDNEADERMRAILEANPQIHILFDSSFTVIDCNPAAVKFMQFDTKEDLISGLVAKLVKSIPKFQSDGRVSIPLPERLMAAARDGFIKFDTDLVLDGEEKNLSVEFKRIPHKDSFNIVAYVFDMTDIHRHEAELQQARELIELQLTKLNLAMKETEIQKMEAEAANKAKSSFLSTMSHEIRTPMNAILGITEIQLQNESITPSVKEAFDKIYASGDLLLGIINDILDLSKIEAGKFEFINANYEVASLISDTAQLNMMRIGSKPIEFELYVDETLPATLSGDELRVKQVFNNILSNAFKYTSAGTVKLSVTAEAGKSDEEMVLVAEVSDTGHGMTKEQVDKLFDEYSRFNMEANRTTEGTGLGMTITRNLLRMMNGNMQVESEPGKGSTFTVRLPQGKTGDEILGFEVAENLHRFRTSSRAQMKRVQVAREPMPYGSVLVVDDVETNIYVAKGLLTPYELKFDSADSGYAAIDKIKAGKVYDIIFMDHMMPKMDGIEATKIIRELGYDEPIVALTANAVSGQAEIFLENGFTDFISKPIDVRQLSAVLNKLVRDKQPPEVLEAARSDAEKKKEKPKTPAPQSTVDPDLVGVFIRDANKSLAVLDKIIEKEGEYSEDDMRTYVIHVHGLKSALANIGNKGLSEFARNLEQSGRTDDKVAISCQTPAFLGLLRAFVVDIAPAEPKAEQIDEDLPFLKQKLEAISAACEQYDESEAEKALEELREKTWSQETQERLDKISELLLHSDFELVTEEIASHS